MGNQMKTTMLLAAMTVIILLIGRMAGGPRGMAMALIFAVGMNFFSYWFSDTIVLKMYQARELPYREAPELHDMVRELCRNAALPMPKLCMIPQDAPNAFATGRDPEHAVVAVTEGLTKLMDRNQIKGVLAHELAHVKNRDILIGSIAAMMAGAIMIFADMARWGAMFRGTSDDDRGGGIGIIFMAIIAPFAAMLIRMAISRSREFDADSTGASFVGDSEGLASALERLGAYSHQLPMTDAKPSSAHLFIVNPLSGRSLTNLFSTHPPLEERIARLRGIRN